MDLTVNHCLKEYSRDGFKQWWAEKVRAAEESADGRALEFGAGAEEIRDRHTKWVAAAYKKVHDLRLAGKGFAKLGIEEGVEEAD